MIRNPFRGRRKSGDLSEVAVDDLLNDFINSLPVTSTCSPKNKPEDVSFTEIFKERTVLDDRQKAEIQGNTCVGCYFSTAVQMLRKELWCSCVNSERHSDAKYFDLRFWVKVESGLPCWRHPLINTDDEWVTKRKGEILDFLLNPEPLTDDDLPPDDTTDRAALAEHYKRAALRTLERCRKDVSTEPGFNKAQKKPEPPVRSEKLSPVKRCQDCYYCVDTRKLPGTWWCACTNPGRSVESVDAGRMWVKSRLGLACWTRKESESSTQ